MINKLFNNIMLLSLVALSSIGHAVDLPSVADFMAQLGRSDMSMEEIKEKMVALDQMRAAMAQKEQDINNKKRKDAEGEDSIPKRQKQPAKRPIPKPNIVAQPPKGATILYRNDDGTYFYSSPEKNGSPVAKAIYTFSAVTFHDQANLPYEKRVNLAKVFPKKLTRQNIYQALLAVEIKLREGLKENPSLVSRTIYAGLTSRSQSKRDKEHAGDIRNGKKDNSTKVKMINIALGEHNVRRSWVVKNVDKWALPIFETMIANLFHVQTFGGSARIGDDESADMVARYNQMKTRQNELKRLGLETVTEDLGAKLFRNQMRAFELGEDGDKDLDIPKDNTANYHQ